MAPPPWVTRVCELDLDDETKGKAIDMIFDMPESDREGFVLEIPAVAKSAILSRLARAWVAPCLEVPCLEDHCLLKCLLAPLQAELPVAL